MSIEARRAARRAAMPVVTAFVESLEREGYEPRVIYASENGITVGKKPQGENAFVIRANYRKEASHAPRRQG